MTHGTQTNVRVVGRYALYGAIAAGGMATVHLGRLLGPVGFSRTVAIKRLHAQFASDPEFVSMFLDEARLAARIRHPNVVPTLDVVATAGELFLVMDYVPGESLARLARALRDRQETIPLRILSAILAGVLHGLHAAHEAKDERGHPLGIVHRDVSPQNVLVGIDGAARVLDFGVAKAAGRMQTTKEGQIKGKLGYMPPEQLRGAPVSRQTDIYAAGVMLWELVTSQRLFSADNEGAVVTKILEAKIEPPSKVLARAAKRPITDAVMRQLEALDAAILRALAAQPEKRFATAREMAVALEKSCPPATASELSDWLEAVARDVLDSRAALVAEIESSASLHAEARDDHVRSVLQGRSTLTPQLPPTVRPNKSSHPPPTPPSSAPPPPSNAPVFLKTLPLSTLRPPTIPFEAPPATQPSSISVARGTFGAPPPPAPTRKRAVFGAALGVLLGLVVLASVLMLQHFVRARHPAQATPTPVPMPAPMPAPVPTPVPVPAPVSMPTVEATVEDAASPAASDEEAPPPKPRATSRPRPSATPAPKASSHEDTDCATPYTYGADGIKRYKPQCLGN